MRCLYYPYLKLDEKTAESIALCFGELFILTPFAIHPRFSIAEVKFIDPLPEVWKEQFRHVLAEYRLFSQVYTDKSFLEYLKHAPSDSSDEEKVSLLKRFLRGESLKKEEKDFPKEVTSALFLYLADEYREDMLGVYKKLQRVRKQEEMLKAVLGPSSELNIGDVTSFSIDYKHPDEDLRNWMHKIFKAWACLIPIKKEFSIFVTDDELAHQHLKHALKDIPHFIYDIYFPSNKDQALWGDLIEIPFTSEFESWAEKLLSPYKRPAENAHHLEVLFVPSLSPTEVFLWITENRKMVKRKKNGLFILWQD